MFLFSRPWDQPVMCRRIMFSCRLSIYLSIHLFLYLYTYSFSYLSVMFFFFMSFLFFLFFCRPWDQLVMYQRIMTFSSSSSRFSCDFLFSLFFFLLSLLHLFSYLFVIYSFRRPWGQPMICRKFGPGWFSYLSFAIFLVFLVFIYLLIYFYLAIYLLYTYVTA